MAFNENNIKRIAFGNATYPANTSANTGSLFTVQTGAHIPTGAIVQSIKWHVGGTVTNGSAMKNATVNVYAGDMAIGTNNVVASVVHLADSVFSHAVVAASGGLVTAGGALGVVFASSDSDRSAIAYDVDVYVEYLYAPSHDA